MSELVCAFCLYDEDRKGQDAEPAITITDGNATCDEHLSWRDMDAFMIEQSRIRSRKSKGNQ
jgi:hypothetical protein